MEGIIDLLEEKNEFLNKFISLNEEGLLNFSEGNFENLDNFYNSREGILAIISKIDSLIERCSNVEYSIENILPQQKRKMIRLLDVKNDLVTNILSQDLQILSFIEEAKSGIIKELVQVQGAKKAIGSYKSGENKGQFSEKA